jgi:sporulation protein YlmC with PRC-barrel domain
VVINLRIREEIIGKEVLNGQAEVLGRVKDVEANEETNEIESLILSKGGISESLGLSSNEVIVPIEQVKQIGDKILLIDKIEYSF